MLLVSLVHLNEIRFHDLRIIREEPLTNELAKGSVEIKVVDIAVSGLSKTLYNSGLLTLIT